ncbi:hypothetical protein LTR70_006872 [Exophiala xenobiotica]|uniref:Uncharacterized protein n=1 Tax=Lithohypha guttulata TaxID=1690604 RepID=A0ABR0K6Z8_9EURO|nr:hypothetical protein LTR24_006393 [Lithohypha guttulata]KAK5315133.1 hypothetical protein LTR70_006872 [Exophiala xenobiotica]
MAVGPPQKLVFDPFKHLNHEPPKKIYGMAEIGRSGQGISPNAVSEPFPLFTEEAIEQMRSEILSKPVLENCQYSSNIAACQLRGFAPKYAPFVYDAWHSPEVLSIVSKIAGIDLVPVMDFEIGHINISINSKEKQEETARALAEHQSREEDEGVSGCPWEDDAPVVDWHTDSYPFVCVLMLSDCTEMIGGETALRTGSGAVMKVRGPGMGNAVILQGRYIEHQALRALGGSERITMVTSFRPRSPHVRDDSVLQTVRAVSDLSELYGGYAEYRLEILEERIRAQLKQLRDSKKTGRRFATSAVKSFISEQKDFLEVMLNQLVDDDKVIAGFTDSSHLISNDLRDAYDKKAKIWEGEE